MNSDSGATRQVKFRHAPSSTTVRKATATGVAMRVALGWQAPGARAHHEPRLPSYASSPTR